MIRRPPRSTRTDTLFPTRRSSDLPDWLLGEGLAIRAGEDGRPPSGAGRRSEEHTSELQSLMRISYAVFCLKKKNPIQPQYTQEKATKLKEEYRLQISTTLLHTRRNQSHITDEQDYTLPS